jgi:hypothetical protein
MSSLAVFLVLGGATAFAATELGKNTVGSKQLKNNAVITAKIKKEAVAAAKIKNGAVSGAKLAAGAVSSDKLGAGAVTGEKLAGGSVDASKLGKGSVTSEKLAINAVQAGNIDKASVTNEKLADNAVTGAKVQDESLTGADINQGSLTSVKAANVYGVTFAETGSGSPKIINASDPGIKSGGCFLVCSVEFPRNVSGCSYTASSTFTSGGSGEPAMAETFPSNSPDSVLVVMWDDGGNLTAHDFALTVVCPTTS